MSSAGNVLKSTKNAVKRTWGTKLTLGTMASVATVFSTLSIAEHGNLRAAGADFRDGVVAVGRPVARGVVGGAEFVGGVIFGDNDPNITIKVPQQIDLPKIELGGTTDNPESTGPPMVAISPGGVACEKLITVVIAESGDSPISLATDAKVANAGSYNVAADSAHDPYPNDVVGICG